MLNREEDQKAVDGTSQVIPTTVEGSCREASIQGWVALGLGDSQRERCGATWAAGLSKRDTAALFLVRFSQASRERLSIRFLIEFSLLFIYLKILPYL